MNYIRQLNTFYRLLPNNPINSNAQCLYMYLLNKNSELGWIKEFTVANSIVMGFTGLNISALQRARNNLIQKGYIRYQKGKGNNAGYYSIIEFEQQNEQQFEQQNEQQTDSRVNNTTNTLNKLKETKLKENNNTSSSLVFFVEENFGRTLSPIEYEEILKWEDTELTRYAIKQAITTNKCSVKYILRILNAYERENVKSVQQAQERERQYIEAKREKRYKQYKTSSERTQEVFERFLAKGEA